MLCRRDVGIFVLVLPFLTLGLLLLGALLQKPWPFNCAWVFVAFVMCICWIFFAIHLPIATVIGDGCVWLNNQEANYTKNIGSKSMHH